MDKDLKEFLSALNAHDVKYLIVGGYAVGVYAEPRATKDLDIWIDVDKENSEAVYRALASFGAPLAGLSSLDFRDDPESIFQIGLPPLRIDILQHIPGVTFESAWDTRVESVIDGELSVNVISLEKLIENKLAVGRPRDLLDVSDMREASASRRGTGKL